jgi:hypothetical protein
MEEFIENVFGNQFFQLPFLEALSYVAAALMVGAIVVGLTRRALGIVSQSAYPTPSVAEPQSSEEEWEWRKAA